MTACLRLCRVEVPEWPRFFPLQGLMTSRYPGEDAVPFSPKVSGITPDVGQQVVTPQTECSPSPAYRADFGETNRTRRIISLQYVAPPSRESAMGREQFSNGMTRRGMK